MVILLDGGVGKELLLQNDEIARDTRVTNGGVWSAVAAIDPQYHKALKLVHRDFMRSGSDLITANNYAITPRSEIFSLKEVVKYTGVACRLALEARHEHERDSEPASDGEKKRVR